MCVYVCCVYMYVCMYVCTVWVCMYVLCMVFFYVYAPCACMYACMHRCTCTVCVYAYICKYLCMCWVCDRPIILCFPDVLFQVYFKVDMYFPQFSLGLHCHLNRVPLSAFLSQSIISHLVGTKDTPSSYLETLQPFPWHTQAGKDMTHTTVLILYLVTNSFKKSFITSFCFIEFY